MIKALLLILRGTEKSDRSMLYVLHYDCFHFVCSRFRQSRDNCFSLKLCSVDYSYRIQTENLADRILLYTHLLYLTQRNRHNSREKEAGPVGDIVLTESKPFIGVCLVEESD